MKFVELTFSNINAPLLLTFRFQYRGLDLGFYCIGSLSLLVFEAFGVLLLTPISFKGLEMAPVAYPIYVPMVPVLPLSIANNAVKLQSGQIYLWAGWEMSNDSGRRSHLDV